MRATRGAAVGVLDRGEKLDLVSLIDWDELRRRGWDLDREGFASSAQDPVFGFALCASTHCDQVVHHPGLGLCRRCQTGWEHSPPGTSLEEFCQSAPAPTPRRWAAACAWSVGRRGMSGRCGAADCARRAWPPPAIAARAPLPTWAVMRTSRLPGRGRPSARVWHGRVFVSPTGPSRRCVRRMSGPGSATAVRSVHRSRCGVCGRVRWMSGAGW